MKCGSAPFWALNVTDVREALDRDRAEYRTFRSGRIMKVSRYVLKQEALAGATFFRVADTAAMDVFMTDVVLRRIRELGLTGLIPEAAELV